MPNRVEASDIYREIVAPAATVALGAIVSSALVAGVQDPYVRAIIILATVLSVSGGVYSVYRAVKLIRSPPAVAQSRVESVQGRDAGLKREAWRHAAAALARDTDTSPMEIRLTGSLKYIRDQAEQGLVASDADKARHLAAIWSMAACDLDDDPEQVAH